MILRFSPQPDSLHSQIFRKAGQKKAEPNRRADAGELLDGDLFGHVSVSATTSFLRSPIVSSSVAYRRGHLEQAKSMGATPTA
jgi:hypothetical protein